MSGEKSTQDYDRVKLHDNTPQDNANLHIMQLTPLLCPVFMFKCKCVNILMFWGVG